MGIKHTKVSNVADAANTSLVRPTDWNADHTIDGDVDLAGHDITNVGNPEDFGATEFTALDDVPATYAGAGNKLVAVNAGATALEFVEPSAGGPVDEFTDLLDVPGSYAGQSGKFAAVNAGETALEFVASSGGTDLGWVTPQDYYPDAGQPGFTGDTIDAADIAAHPEWIGTYKTGSHWSYVAIQEAIYGAYAYYDSTPGNVIWNNQNIRTNKVLYMPPGVYNINHMLHMTAQDFNFMCSARGTSVIRYQGGHIIEGDSHSSTTIDGIDPATIAQLSLSDTLYVAGPGILERLAVGVNAIGATSITLDTATTTTVANGQWHLWGSAFVCNAVSYGAFHNLSITALASMPSTGTIAAAGVSMHAPALFVLTWNGANPGLKTQQLTLYDARITGSYLADIGISISPDGGSSQGDTILLVNPVIQQCLREGLNILGANSLNIQVINGNFQANRFAGVKCHGGSVYVHGSSFQPGNFNNNFSPVINSVINMSADIHLIGFGGPSSTPDIMAVRSEGQQLVYAHSGSDPSVRNYGTGGGETFGHITEYPFQLGHYIAEGTPARTFICVDTGGPNIWYLYSSGTGNTLTLAGASWTVNAWVGLRIMERFGSNGFTWELGTVTSNTANTVTWSGTAAAPAADSYYFIGGITGVTKPSQATFSAVSTSVKAFDSVGTGQGFNTTAGSTTIDLGSGITSAGGGVNIGDYVIIPQADRLGATQAEVSGINNRIPPIKCALIAQITAIPGSYTLDKPAAYTNVEVPGWLAHNTIDTVTDGNITWAAVDTFDFWGCYNLEKVTAGRIYNCVNVSGLRSSHDYNWNSSSNLVSTSDSKHIINGKTVRIATSSIDPSVSPVDISATLEAGDITGLTPTQNITLNAASLVSVGTQKWTLIVTTSGTTPYTITFGTNFHVSSSTLVTGAVDAKKFIIEFLVTGVGLYEASRTGAL